VKHASEFSFVSKQISLIDKAVNTKIYSKLNRRQIISIQNTKSIFAANVFCIHEYKKANCGRYLLTVNTFKSYYNTKHKIHIRKCMQFSQY